MTPSEIARELMANFRDLNTSAYMGEICSAFAKALSAHGEAEFKRGCAETRKNMTTDISTLHLVPKRGQEGGE